MPAREQSSPRLGNFFASICLEVHISCTLITNCALSPETQVCQVMQDEITLDLQLGRRFNGHLAVPVTACALCYPVILIGAIFRSCDVSVMETMETSLLEWQVAHAFL